MPLYTYRCQNCNLEYDELVKMDERDGKRSCKRCGGPAARKVGVRFGVHSALNPKKDTISTPSEIDRVVGAASEKKWAGYNEKWRKRYEERQAKRWAGRTPEVISLPKDPDGKYTPVAHLGDAKERATRQEFSTALKEHRAEREKKGLGQFDRPGAISTEPVTTKKT